VTAEVFPCFGLQSLGMCAYNPAQPSFSYFSVGDAIAALAFTLAIQQLFKPIYLFRLRVYGLSITKLSIAVFAGAFCCIVAMILPNMPINHTGILEYPIFWELFGGLLIFGAYGTTAWVSLKPARIYALNLHTFVGAAASLLSEASDDDRVSFARDLFTGGNFKRLFAYASAWTRAEWQASAVAFERLRETAPPGTPLTIAGRPRPSAFYLFAHRRELTAGRDAIALLQIISDPDFCAVLVRKCSWLTAAMLDMLAKDELHIDQAKSFVQEIANQAILNDDSMLAKETGYTGFGTVPYLSQALFGNWFILNRFEPLQGLGFKTPKAPSEGFVGRLNTAGKLMFTTAIKGGSYWGEHYIYGVQDAYEHVIRNSSYANQNPLSVEFRVTLHLGIRELYKMMGNALDRLSPDRRKSLFIRDKKKFTNDIVDALASIIYESLARIANDFRGADDNSWTHAISVIMDIYPQYESTIACGMDPLQQRVAIKLIDKLSNNMDGWYPAISRVLLSTIGPYAGGAPPANRTAFVILKDAVYRELQKLPALSTKHPDRLTDFFPPSVTYDIATNTLSHVYRDGRAIVTDLASLQIPEIDLLDERNWQLSGTADPALQDDDMI